MRLLSGRFWLAVFLSPALLAGSSLGRGASDDHAIVRYLVAISGSLSGEVLTVSTWDERQTMRTMRFAVTPGGHHVTVVDFDDPNAGEMRFRLDSEEAGTWIELVIDLGVANLEPNQYGAILHQRLDEEGGTVTVRLEGPEDVWELAADESGSGGLAITDNWVERFWGSDRQLEIDESLREGARFVLQVASSGSTRLDPIMTSFLKAAGWPSPEAFEETGERKWSVTEEAVTDSRADEDLRRLMKAFPALSRGEIARLLRFDFP